MYGTYLFVPKNDNYENSALLAFDADNRPIAKEAFEGHRGQKKRPSRPRRCYKAVTLLHTNRKKQYYLYCGLRLFNGAENDLPHLRPIMEEFMAGACKIHIHYLVFDRGFIDFQAIGTLAIGYLKQEFGIDCVFPLKRNMEAYREAQALASLKKRPDCVWKPEEKEEPSYEGKVRSYKEA